MLKDFTEKVNNTHEHMGYFSREVETRPRTAKGKIKTLTEMQNAPDGLTGLTSWA